jgi:hypothetical protein
MTVSADTEIDVLIIGARANGLGFGALAGAHGSARQDYRQGGRTPDDITSACGTGPDP